MHRLIRQTIPVLAWLHAVLAKKKRLEVNFVGSVRPYGWGWFPLEMCLGQRCAHLPTPLLFLSVSLTMLSWHKVWSSCGKHSRSKTGRDHLQVDAPCSASYMQKTVSWPVPIFSPICVLFHYPCLLKLSFFLFLPWLSCNLFYFPTNFLMQQCTWKTNNQMDPTSMCRVSKNCIIWDNKLLRTLSYWKNHCFCGTIGSLTLMAGKHFLQRFLFKHKIWKR